MFRVTENINCNVQILNMKSEITPELLLRISNIHLKPDKDPNIMCIKNKIHHKDNFRYCHQHDSIQVYG